MRGDTEGHICIASRIRTPDGTILHSRHQHDFVQHCDVVSGEVYSLDGGNAYKRISLNTVPAEDISVYTDNDHIDIREVFCWGTYGEFGNKALHYLYLKDLTNDHIRAILNTQMNLKDHIKKIFNDELEWRDNESRDP